MEYRVVLPAELSPGQSLHVIYLLHGGGGGFRDWTNYSDVAHYADEGILLVMPEGESSYYMNSATRVQDRFEDYITHDLIADVEEKFPVRRQREDRAIAGISMGGFGAVVLGLKHPELYAFVGGLSSALDVPTRPFSIKRVDQWRHHSSIFGPSGSEARSLNDPYKLARTLPPSTAPYFFLSCGEQEGLLPANRRFAEILKERHFAYEFHTGRGGHDWNQWNKRLPELFGSLKSAMSQTAGRK